MRFASVGLALALMIGVAGSAEAARGKKSTKKVFPLTGTVIRVYRDLGYLVLEDHQGYEHSVRLSDSHVRVRNRRASAAQAQSGDSIYVQAAHRL